MKNPNDKRNAIVGALLAFVNLGEHEEREFIATMNLLLRVSPKKRREMIDQLRQDASRGEGFAGTAARRGPSPSSGLPSLDTSFPPRC
jgi:hypothetical protein